MGKSFVRIFTLSIFFVLTSCDQISTKYLGEAKLQGTDGIFFAEDVELGKSATKNFTLQNVGVSDATLSNVEGSNPVFTYEIVDPKKLIVAATFKPGAIGSVEDTLNIQYKTAGSLHSVKIPVMGKGFDTPPVMAGLVIPKIINKANAGAVKFSGKSSKAGSLSFYINDVLKQIVSFGADAWSWDENMTSGISDGNLKFKFVVRSNAGAESSWEETALKDTVADTLTLSAPSTINQAVATAGVQVSGTVSEFPRTIKLFANGTLKKEIAATSSNWSSPLDLTGIPQGNINLKVTTEDTVGNPSEATASSFLDTVAPTLNISTTGNISLAAYMVSGDCENGSLFSITANSQTIYSGNCLGAFTNLNLVFPAAVLDGNVQLKFRATDSAGNFREVIRNVMKDTVAPTVQIVNPNGISLANYLQYSLSVSTTEAGMLKLYINSDSTPIYTQNISGGSYTISNLNLQNYPDSTVQFKVTVTDGFGNSGLANASATKDTVAPAAFSIGNVNPYLVGTSQNVTLNVPNLEDLYNLKVSDSANCSTPLYDLNQASNIFALPNALTVGTHYLCATAYDAAGNSTSASNNGLSFIVVNTTTLTSINPTSGNYLGGTQVTIQFSQLSSNVNISNVSIGGSPCNGVNVNLSTNSLTCTTSAHAIGSAAVTVVTQFQTITGLQYDFIVLPPTITSISPVKGPIEGGQKITINGSKFLSTANIALKINNVPCGSLVIIDDSKMTCKTGASTAGTYPLMLTAQYPSQSVTGPNYQYDSAEPPMPLRLYDAAAIDGNPNTGNISSRTDTVWKDLSENHLDAQVKNFIYQTATAGWDGDNTIANPSRLKFPNVSSYSGYVSLGQETAKTYSIWFTAPNSSAATGLFHRQNNLAIYVQGGLLNVSRLNEGTYFNSAISMNTWHHLAVVQFQTVTSPPSNQYRIYLDGVQLTEVQIPSTNLMNNLTILGSNFYSDGYVDGYYAHRGNIAIYESFTQALREEQVQTLYGQDYGRFFPLNSLAITKVTPGVVTTVAPAPVYVYGINIGGVTQVKIGGIPVAFNYETPSKIKLTMPVSSVGFKTLELTIGSGNAISIPRAVLYTGQATTTLSSYFHAANIDLKGNGGSGASALTWESLTGTTAAGSYVDIFYYNASMFWNWLGNTLGPTNPFRYNNYNLNLFNAGNVSAQTYSMWFRSESSPSNYWQQDLFGRLRGISAGVQGEVVNNVWVKKLKFYTRNVAYNDSWGYEVYNQPIDSNWHQLAITNNSTDKRDYYLDGVLIFSCSGSCYYGPEQPTTLTIGQSYQYGGGFWLGSIGQFKTHTTYRSAAEIQAEFNEEKGWYLP